MGRGLTGVSRPAGYVTASPARQLVERTGWVTSTNAQWYPFPWVPAMVASGAPMVRTFWHTTTPTAEALVMLNQAHAGGLQIIVAIMGEAVVTALTALGWQDWMGSLIAVENYNEPHYWRFGNDPAFVEYKGAATHHGSGSLPLANGTPVV